MAAIFVGTSGYGYDAWVGSVYPEGTKPSRFLERYSGLYPTVELNRTFYAIPTAEQLRKNLEQAGTPFLFAVKANGTLTHRISSASWKASAASFRTAISEVGGAGRLAAVLFQFPPGFHNTEDRRGYLFELLDEFVDFPVALEFRYPDWYNNAMVDVCRKLRVALVSTDLPEFPGLPPLMDVLTAPFAYFRFHGRNSAGWAHAASASRYDYSYSDAELEGLAARVKGVAPRAERVFIYFNNSGMAADARRFTGILSRMGLSHAG